MSLFFVFHLRNYLVNKVIVDSSNILNILSTYNLNLTKIQSIPIIETPWKYSFFIDTTFPDFNKYEEAIKKVSLQSELVKEFGVYNNFKS